LLDGVITLTRRKSRQFNFSSQAKIYHIEFEEKFLIKTYANVKYFCQKTAERIFQQAGKETNGTLNDFMRKFGTIGSTERTAVIGWPFCAIFSFTR